MRPGAANHRHTAILIVDDNSVNLTVAKGLIEPLEMVIDTAESAAEAIKMVSKTKYDLIFISVSSPESLRGVSRLAPDVYSMLYSIHLLLKNS